MVTTSSALSILICLTMLLNQGCAIGLGAAGGYAGYQALSSKTESTSDTSAMQSYLNYKMKMQKSNSERERTGQNGERILTYDEWLKAEGINPNK